MTLQQKLIAKQSKKGFTLVELVVVIAILAILAAIAIPAVIGIINSASKSSGESDASTLNSACKTFYAGVQSGTITTSSKNADNTAVTKAAAPGAANSVRITAAKNATVKDAATYSGLYTGGTDADLADFYVATDGTIKYQDPDSAAPTSTRVAKGSLKFTTTLGTVYGSTTTTP